MWFILEIQLSLKDALYMSSIVLNACYSLTPKKRHVIGSKAYQKNSIAQAGLQCLLRTCKLNSERKSGGKWYTHSIYWFHTFSSASPMQIHKCVKKKILIFITNITDKGRTKNWGMVEHPELQNAATCCKPHFLPAVSHSSE